MAFQSIAVSDIKSNPFRNDESYKTDEKKVLALMESIEDTSFWENLLARKNKDGDIELAYGHHRLEALRRLNKLDAEAGIPVNDRKYAIIKLNVRPHRDLTDEDMLKILAQENKADWQDSPENFTMTILQVQHHLDTLLHASKDAEEFVKKAGGKINCDSRSFTRFKNNGIGASTIQQFLGDTWSRPYIQEGLDLIKAGDRSEELKALAAKLPNITLASRFRRLVTKEGKGDKAEYHADDVQKKVADTILKNELNRADVEQAIKLAEASEDKDPVKAIEAVVEAKKQSRKDAAAAARAAAPPKKSAMEKLEDKFDSLLETIRKVRKELTADDLVKCTELVSLVEEELAKEPEPEEAGGEDGGDSEE